MINPHFVFSSALYRQRQNKKYIKAFNKFVLSFNILKENIGTFLKECAQRFMYVLEYTPVFFIFLDNKTHYFAI